MNEQIDKLLTNPYFETLAVFSVSILALVIFISFFELVTRYKDWEQIKQGNVAVSMAIVGKIIGICIIFRFALIQKPESIYHELIWGSFGFLLLLIAYYIFEFLTPVFKVDKELEKGNKAVGLIAMLLSVSLSLVIGASIP
ncbi:DUF350 domain-containing protein [Longirhabdus pacifica]|uniref:DUF350 domain-containing protein n=1 Tax=Longirhabdus pacifica TaxID=2305227 RepID=UPI001008DBE0|nr:DUF350 domain-containing protein [Longirhabdus pacifica]